VIDGRLDLLQAQDVWPLSLDEGGHLILAGADAVDVPGGDLHRRAISPVVEAENMRMLF
jgi:hypothetical protein